jgi:hypothetical protein
MSYNNIRPNVPFTSSTIPLSDIKFTVQKMPQELDENTYINPLTQKPCVLKQILIALIVAVIAYYTYSNYVKKE